MGCMLKRLIVAALILTLIFVMALRGCPRARKSVIKVHEEHLKVLMVAIILNVSYSNRTHYWLASQRVLYS